jgi:hypothetical protein
VQAIEGRILIRKGTKLPHQLRPYGNAIDGDWLMLSDDASTLNGQVRAADWHFFCLAEQVQGWAVGREKEEASRKALRRAARKIASSRNGAEIFSIQHKLICGFYFCRVQLAARHIQREMILHLAPAVALISPTVKPETGLSQPLKRRRSLQGLELSSWDTSSCRITASSAGNKTNTWHAKTILSESTGRSIQSSSPL